MPPHLHGPDTDNKSTSADDFASSNHFIESELNRKLGLIGEKLGGDVITLVAPMHQPIDDFVRDAIEDIQNKSEKLFVVLETQGGSIEIVERIADVFRHFYPKEVGFIVPNYAMSAGTVLVMCGDRILMDYYSVLGPIDPQVKSRTRGDVFVPALGYLSKYDELVKKSSQGLLTSVEVAFFIEKFDPAEMRQFEMAKELSVDLLKKWLVAYKFKNWTKTRSNGQKVSLAMKEKRAAEIADKLNDTNAWKVHGRGLSMKVLEKDLNLQIEDFGAETELNRCIRSYYRLLQDYMIGNRQTLVIQTPGRYFGLGV